MLLYSDVDPRKDGGDVLAAVVADGGRDGVVGADREEELAVRGEVLPHPEPREPVRGAAVPPRREAPDAVTEHPPDEHEGELPVTQGSKGERPQGEGGCPPAVLGDVAVPVRGVQVFVLGGEKNVAAVYVGTDVIVDVIVIVIVGGVDVVDVIVVNVYVVCLVFAVVVVVDVFVAVAKE